MKIVDCKDDNSRRITGDTSEYTETEDSHSDRGFTDETLSYSDSDSSDIESIFDWTCDDYGPTPMPDNENLTCDIRSNSNRNSASKVKVEGTKVMLEIQNLASNKENENKASYNETNTRDKFRSASSGIATPQTSSFRTNDDESAYSNLRQEVTPERTPECEAQNQLSPFMQSYLKKFEIEDENLMELPSLTTPEPPEEGAIKEEEAPAAEAKGFSAEVTSQLYRSDTHGMLKMCKFLSSLATFEYIHENLKTIQILGDSIILSFLVSKQLI